MSEFDELGRRAGAHAREQAAEVADTDAQLVALRSSLNGDHRRRPRHRARRIAVGIAASLVVAAGIGAIVWQARGDGDGGLDPTDTFDQPVASDESPSSTPLDPPASATTEVPSPVATAQPSTTENTPDQTTDPALDPPVPTLQDAEAGTDEEAAMPTSAEVLRPVLASSECTPASATAYETPTEAPPPPLHLFGRRVDDPVPIQVFADPDLGPTGPFAAAILYDEPSQPMPAPGSFWASVDVGGNAGVVATSDDGRVDVVWSLPDGSQVVLRSTGLGDDATIAFARSLEPRGADADIPGLDTGTDDLVLAAESMNDDVRGAFSSSECALVDEPGYYVAGSVRGDPVFQYLALVDRPDAPDDVERRGDGIVFVVSRNAPALDASVVIDAEPVDWVALRAAPPVGFPAEPQDRTVLVDQWAYVELRPVSGASETPPSPLGLRIRLTDGVAILEVDQSEVVVDERAEYKTVELAPGGGGISTARAGTVSGYRIGDDDGGPLALSVEVRYISSAGEDIQTTGPLTLQLQR